MTSPNEETQAALQVAEAPPTSPEVDEDEAATAAIIAEINDMNAAEGVSGVVEPEGEMETPAAEAPAPAVTETPSEVPAVVPPITPAAQPDPYVQGLERQVREQAAKQVQAEMDQRAEQVRQNLLADGVDEGTAARLAGERRQSDQRFIDLQSRTSEAMVEQQAKMTLVAYFNQTYGLDMATLLRYNDPVAMEQAAKLHKDMATMKAENAAFRKAAVPASIVDNGHSSPGANMSEERLVDSALSKVHGDRTDAENAAMARMAGAV